jgi:inhibitor of KinA
MNDYRLVPAGDSAVIVEFADRVDAVVNARAVRLAAAVRAASVAGVRDVVPTFRSVAVYFDPLKTDLTALGARLDDEARRPSEEPASSSVVSIPVTYGGASGPDLTDVAKFAGISEAEVVAIHTGCTYRVFMLGFLPGFAYMGKVDARIAAPRRSTPRIRVPAGSVGIAGVQTGIYPSDTPGGWQLVGRTTVRPFDRVRPDPFLLKAGDSVRFYSVQADRG